MNRWEVQYEEVLNLLEPFSKSMDEDLFYRSSYLHLKRMPKEAKELRFLAMEDLYTFAKLVNPGYMYGEIHKEAMQWMQQYSLFDVGEGQSSNKLLMFPRAHLKSHMVATWCAWIITRHPEVTCLYLSATAELAEMQLYAIKSIFESEVYQRFWPEYIHPMEGKRKKWTERKIIIDHVLRGKEGVRDPTVTTAGLTTNTTGWHADLIIPDDLVIPENAFTEDGRNSVMKKSSQFTSIRNPGGFTMACGTRYHPVDVYHTWKNQEYEVYDDEGNLIDRLPTWEIMERVVEINGVFLWPRAVRSDGKAFGFDQNTLARIKAEYEDITQFYAQYYNNPNSPGSERINRDCFQYYDQKYLIQTGGNWFFKEKRLNVYAAIDFAFSLNKRADYSCIAVIGIDSDGCIYMLDILRFKTDKSLDYFKNVAHLHSKWGFKKLRAEVTVAQQIIVNDLKEHIKSEGLILSVEDHRPTRNEGSKAERIAAVLEYRYENRMIWHYNGGYTPVLEDELVLLRPPHDDVKDAVANAIEISIKPKHKSSAPSLLKDLGFNTKRSRFGGVPFR